MVRKKTASAEPEEGHSSTHDIWKGSIAFGLVEIPVALVSAEQPGGISLSQLDRRDFSPIGYRRYNKVSNEEVPWSEIVRGYEYAKGEYVVIGKEDLAQANPVLSRTIAIEQFVDAEAVDLIYFDKPYYLEPQKVHSKSYALLRETLRRTEKVGVARVAIRSREHLALVGVRGPAIVLYLLRFPSEVRAPAQLDNLGRDAKAAEVSAKELALAERLVADMTGPWNPEAYGDTYTQDLMKFIEQKVKSGDVHALEGKPEAPAAKARGELVDLMPLLRRSVEAATKGAAKARPRPAKSGSSRRSSRPVVGRSA